MTVGNFLEIIGTAGFDSLTGSDLEIIYGLDDLDSLVAGSGINSNINSTTILVGGSGDNLYSIRDDATAIIFENSGTDDNTLFTTILASGINFNDPSLIIAEIDNRHLYFGNTISNQYQNTDNGTFLYAGLEESNAIDNNPDFSNIFTLQGGAFNSFSW